MAASFSRVLVVDDYEPWRRFLCSFLQRELDLLVVAQASDGLEAVQISAEFQPDLILLDVGLPKLNGIQAARRIRELAPRSTIVFVSENRSWEVAEAALGAGASAYVLKSDASSELILAIRGARQGSRFVSAAFRKHCLVDAEDADTSKAHSQVIPASSHDDLVQHKIEIYQDDASLVHGFAGVIKAALAAGNPVVVIASESHRGDILRKFRLDAVDIDVAKERGIYAALDSRETLSRFMVDGMPDPIRCSQIVDDLISCAGRAAENRQARLVICGECAPILLEEGNDQGAIRVEQLWDEASRTRGLDTLCGYLARAFQRTVNGQTFQRICAEHSAVRGRALCD